MNRKHVQKLLRARKGKRDAVLQLSQQWSDDVLPGNPMANTEEKTAEPRQERDLPSGSKDSRRRFL